MARCEPGTGRLGDITDRQTPVAYRNLSPAPGHPSRARRFAGSAVSVEGAREVAIAVTIGGSAALIIIGAILRFGVTWKPAHVDLQVIGVILMVAGALGLVISVVFMVMRRNDRRSAQVYEERRYTDPPV
jgi:hypothetical protein